MDIKTLRTMTGMSQEKFGQKYGIPKRTIEDWEAGRRTAPAYVIEMLTKVVKMEEVNMKAWMFNEYRDKAGTGTTELFKTKEDAIKYGKDMWNCLNEADRRSYHDDPCGEFLVAEVPVEWDETFQDWCPDCSAYTPEWDALTEKKPEE